MDKPTSKILKIFALILLGHFYTISYAQVSIKKMDSLYSVVKDVSDADSVNLIANKLLKQTRASNYKLGTINLLLLKAVTLYNSGKFDLALKETYNLERELQESSDYGKLSHLFAIRANCYGNLFYFDKSNQCLLEAKRYAEKIKDNDLRYFNIGRVYRLYSINIENNTTIPVNRDSVMYYRKKATICNA